MRRVLDGEAGGYDADPDQTVEEYLEGWLGAKELTLKPTTYARYCDYVTNDLIPSLGALRLDDLGHRQILALVRRQLAAGRGRTTVYRCLATLSSASGDAVRHHRLASNPASPPVMRRPPSPQRVVWTADEAARFLEYAHVHDPLLADLCEVLIGTGMRKGEALGPHWDDVHLDAGVLYVRYTLSCVDSNRLVITSPKTRNSRNWVAISGRVGEALRRRAAEQRRDAADPRSGQFADLVFTRPDGRPLRPQTLLDRFRRLSAEVGLPRITMHDLRHLAATLTIAAGVPLVVVSKTLRHSTLSTTANIYAHLTRPAARAAVVTIQRVLAQAEEHLTNGGVLPGARGALPPEPRGWLQQVTNLMDPRRAAARPPFEPATTLRPPEDAGRGVGAADLTLFDGEFMNGARRPAPDRDHPATTTPPDTEKAAPSVWRERPPTCVNAGRGDRI
ncbi:site-specific integrase [Yinghuangia aomiensis]|uniref:Site-specific integrase n=1 Tax=Yinghuangia aomiensis TaxID=676205 RepID=A0ABP9IHJ7_9ACTN